MLQLDGGFAGRAWGQSRNVQQLPKTNDPVVIRTDFDNQQAWETICKLIRAPVHEFGEPYYAYVEFLDDTEFRNLSKEELLARVPGDYNHTFLLVVDSIAISQPEFPILVIDVRIERGRSFRATPEQIQGIQNNLSIANMDFYEFADAV